MQAGKLRHLITVQSKTTTRNDHGEAVPAWLTFDIVRGEVKQLSGAELMNAQQVQSVAKYRVKLRYLAGLLETMQLEWQGRTLGILDVENVEGRNREMILLCAEVKT